MLGAWTTGATCSRHPSRRTSCSARSSSSRPGAGCCRTGLPEWARQYADGRLAMAEAQPSGVRLAFRSRATYIRVETVPTKQVYVGAPPRPDGVYELVVDGRATAQATAPGGDILTIDLATVAAEVTPGAGGPRVRRASRRGQGGRGLAALERADRARRALDGRPRRTTARPCSPQMGAPRQLDQHLSRP